MRKSSIGVYADSDGPDQIDIAQSDLELHCPNRDTAYHIEKALSITKTSLFKYIEKFTAKN